MLSLGHILISDFFVADLFTSRYDSILLGRIFYIKVFLHEILSILKVNNNYCKQQINTSSWEHPRESNQHTAVEFFTLIKYTNLTHQSKGLSK